MPNALQSHTRLASGAAGFTKAQSKFFQTPIPEFGQRVMYVMQNKVRLPNNLFCHYIYHNTWLEHIFYSNFCDLIIFTEMTSIRPTTRSRSTSTTDSSISDDISRTITSTATSDSETTTLGSTSVPPPSTFWPMQQLRRYQYKLYIYSIIIYS